MIVLAGRAKKRAPLPPFQSLKIGVYGVSLLVVTAAAAIAARQFRTGLALLAAVALATYLPRTASTDAPLTVAAVQGEGVGFDAYLTLSRETAGDLDAIVWPEYAVVPDIRKNPVQLESVTKLLAAKNAAHLTLGTRTEREDGAWSNTAVTLGPDGVLGVHDKNRPVHLLDDGRAGTEVAVIDTPLARIATTICFDNDYAAIPRQAVAQGAELFLIPSMDAAHWTARQHLQHAELARHRAAENARWMVVASSSGLTQALDPQGRRVGEIPLFEPGVLVARVGLRRDLTFHTRFGWLLGPASTILATLLLVLTAVLSHRRQAGPTLPLDPGRSRPHTPA